VFSVLGYIAHETNSEIDKVAGAGLSLTFVTFPTALSKMSLAPLWSILFFVMLVTVGIDTQMADMETQLTAFFDQYPWLRKKKPLVVLGVTCAGAEIRLSYTNDNYQKKFDDHWKDPSFQ
jgi:solute carrier family 6 amino acid transporter-like protein 5/7/9/14